MCQYHLQWLVKLRKCSNCIATRVWSVYHNKVFIIINYIDMYWLAIKHLVRDLIDVISD